jgi:hypothetical protein
MANRCDELTGECVATRLPYGTPCPSSPSGFCEGPFCIGIIPPLNISCAPPPNYCQSYIFKENSFPPECVLVNVNEGNQCDDGVACTGVRLRHTHHGHSSRGLFDNVAATQRATVHSASMHCLHCCCILAASVCCCPSGFPHRRTFLQWTTCAAMACVWAYPRHAQSQRACARTLYVMRQKEVSVWL